MFMNKPNTDVSKRGQVRPPQYVTVPTEKDMDSKEVLLNLRQLPWNRKNFSTFPEEDRQMVWS